MNKTDLIERLAEKHSLSKAEAGRVLETLLDTIVAQVKKGDAVTIPGVNPSTGAKIKIAAAKLPKFTPGATFKAAVDAKAAARKAAKAPAAKPAKAAKAAKPTAKAAKPVVKAAKPAAKPAAKKAAAKKK
jgi:DNA-binding protein HU-beta